MLLKLITAELVKANTISWEAAHWWSLSLDEEEEENTNLLWNKCLFELELWGRALLFRLWQEHSYFMSLVI